MDISRNKITGEIKQAPNLGKHFRLGDWENCLDSNGDIKESHQEALYSLKLKEVIELKKAEINKQRNDAIEAPYKFTKNGKVYLLSRSIRSELAWLKFCGKDTLVPWITDDNSEVEINKSEFKVITTHLGDRDTGEVLQARRRKNAVMAIKPSKTKTIEEAIKEVEEFDIEQIYIDATPDKIEINSIVKP
jgi:hypothetical protein